MGDVATEISEATGRSLRYEDVPPKFAKERMLEGGLPSPLADFLVAFYGMMREGSTDFVTSTVPEVTSGPGRTLGAFAQEHASSFDSFEPRR